MGHPTEESPVPDTLTCPACTSTSALPAVLHDVYLPFSREDLRSHFARVTGSTSSCKDKYLHYYLDSLQ